MEDNKTVFINEVTDPYGKVITKTVHTTYHVSLPELINAFQCFLKGCGYDLEEFDVGLVGREGYEESKDLPK